MFRSSRSSFPSSLLLTFSTSHLFHFPSFSSCSFSSSLPFSSAFSSSSSFHLFSRKTSSPLLPSRQLRFISFSRTPKVGKSTPQPTPSPGAIGAYIERLKGFHPVSLRFSLSFRLPLVLFLFLLRLPLLPLLPVSVLTQVLLTSFWVLCRQMAQLSNLFYSSGSGYWRLHCVSHRRSTNNRQKTVHLSLSRSREGVGSSRFQRSFGIQQRLNPSSLSPGRSTSSTLHVLVHIPVSLSLTLFPFSSSHSFLSCSSISFVFLLLLSVFPSLS
jgi:hypothetical protein